MFLNRKRPEDKSEADRQKIIAFKQTFGTDLGREVLFDLLNKYHVLNPVRTRDLTGHLSQFELGIQEGQRTVVLDILSKCQIDMAQFDRLLKGEII